MISLNSCTPVRLYAIALSLAMLILPNFLAAQYQFLTTYAPSDIVMSDQTKIRYQQLANDLGEGVKIIATSSIRENPLDTLRFDLPGYDSPIEVVGDLIVDEGAEGLQWSGRVLKRPGYLCIVEKDKKTAGFLQVGFDFFQILPIDEKYQFLVKAKNNMPAGCGNGKIQNSDPPPGPEKCSYELGYNTYNTCPAIISVLLVITKEARTWIEYNFGSVEVFATLGQMTVDYAFYNSDIPNKEVRLKWVFDDTDLQNNGLLSADVEFDRGKFPDIMGTLRTENKADVAFLIVNDVYLSSGAGGAVTDIGPFFNKAFGFVEAQAFVQHYSFAHELGHLMGCRHNWVQDLGDDDTPVCAHAMRIRTLPEGPIVYNDPNYSYPVSSWHTIVGIPPFFSEYKIEDSNGFYYIRIENDARILHYSNPAVYYNGHTTGRADGYIANNASHIRNEGCTVANFFAEQEFSFNINTSICESTPYNLYADIVVPGMGMAGQPPYKVIWAWNTTGFFAQGNFQIMGEGNGISLAKHPDCPVYWIKCFVISADNVVVSRIKKIDISKCGCKETIGNRDIESPVANKSNPNAGFSVQPNPTLDGDIVLYSGQLSDVDAPLKVVDMTGKTHYQATQYFHTDGMASLHLDIPAGIYFLSVNMPEGKTQPTKLLTFKN